MSPFQRVKRYLWVAGIAMVAAGLGPRLVAAGGLDGSVVVAVPDAMCMGDINPIVITQTVTNTGLVNIYVTPDESLSVDPMFAAFWLQGPSSFVSPPVTLNPGKSVTFTWLYSVSSFVGFIRFSATTYGDDGVATFFTALGDSNLVEIVDPWTVLSVSAVAIPSPAEVGQLVGIEVFVINSKKITATIFTPSLSVGPGEALLTLVSAPVDMMDDLAAMSSRSYTWTYSVTGAGLAVFSITATGMSCFTLAEVYTQTSASLVLPPPCDPIGIVVRKNQIPPNPGVGAPVTYQIVVTNTGLGVINTLMVVDTASPVVASVMTDQPPMFGPPLVTGVPGTGTRYEWMAGGLGMTPGTTFTFTITGIVGEVSVSTLVSNMAFIEANNACSTSAMITGLVDFTIVPLPVVKAPADLAIASLTLNPGPNVTSGDTVTATLVLSNSGGIDAEVISITETVSQPGVFELSSLLPSTLFMVPAGATKTVTWTYLAVSCGTASGDVTVMGMDPSGNNALGPVVAGLTVVVTGPGTPTTLTLEAGQTQAQVGDVVDLTVEVSDNCVPPNPVVGASVTLAVQAGGGLVSPMSGVTDSAGRMTARLALGAEPGSNVVTVAVSSAGGATLNGTVTVEGTPLSSPRPSLSKNFFNPGKGEDVKVRVLMPQAARPTVTIRIYNMAGELIRSVSNVPVQAGLAEWPWDGRNAEGSIVGNGVYFIQIDSGKHVEIKRVIVLKR